MTIKIQNCYYIFLFIIIILTYLVVLYFFNEIRYYPKKVCKVSFYYFYNVKLKINKNEQNT